MKRTIHCCVLLVICALAARGHADEFDQILRPLLVGKCGVCHGYAEAHAAINFERLATSREHWIGNPELIQKTLEAIDSTAMPPEGEEPLADASRTAAVSVLKTLLRQASEKTSPPPQPTSRLNRFQYNNTVRDLFQLNRDVFELPEKLMTRYDDYLRSSSEQAPAATETRAARLPDTVHVASHALRPLPGLALVQPFPKDLRAEHGFDNQADQLTLSPLLLDAFLRLSVSIVESPDFNAETVGIWNEFFAPPEGEVDLKSTVRQRLARFLRRAFRGPIDDDTLDRYVAYTSAKLEQGLPFTEAMKKVSAAALSSPLFLYRASPASQQQRQFELASRLSYFLWASCPDDELLDLAERGELSRGEVLDQTVSRMLADPKIERFLDSFPVQWMQLENLMAATPDPAITRYFHLDQETPASLQMVLEPLLLFDAVFVEDRPIAELIIPPFGYQSDFLNTWYNTDLQPPPVNREAIVATNQQRDELRLKLRMAVDSTQQQLDDLIVPVRSQLLESKRGGAAKTTGVDLKPYAAWEFDGDLLDSAGNLHLKSHGEISYLDGMVALNKSYLLSEPLPVDLRAKSLEVRFRLANLDQRGGGLMGIQGPGDFFDTIVIGERMNRHWISGSNGFSRTEDFPGSTEETAVDDMLHLLMVYSEDGTTMLYRNGQPYGQPFRKGPATFPKEKSSVIFGLRHLPPGGNRYLSVVIDQARLYDRALTSEEAAAAAAGSADFIPTAELLAAMTEQQRSQREQLLASLGKAREELGQVPANVDPAQAVEQSRLQFEDDLRRQLRSREFRRVEVDDRRYGGIITNAAMLSMTSGPKRTHPVARGVWIIEVILNDPPAPPPNDVPPLNEDAGDKNQTIRERFAAHRDNPSCAGCHSKLDPLGFALENFDITGRWRDKYDNGRTVDAAGTLLRKHEFANVLEFKDSLLHEHRRFAEAFTEHLLRFALARDLHPADSLTVDAVLERTADDHFKLRSIIRNVVLSPGFQQSE